MKKERHPKAWFSWGDFESLPAAFIRPDGVADEMRVRIVPEADYQRMLKGLAILDKFEAAENLPEPKKALERKLQARAKKDVATIKRKMSRQTTRLKRALEERGV